MMEKAYNNISIWEIIKYAQDKLVYKAKPSKPKLNTADPTAEQARLYVDACEKYNKDLKEYEKEYVQLQEHNSIIYSVIEEFIKDQSGFYLIPEKYQGRVWSYAWDQGHSSGYSEIYSCLCRLQYIFVGE